MRGLGHLGMWWKLNLWHNYIAKHHVMIWYLWSVSRWSFLSVCLFSTPSSPPCGTCILTGVRLRPHSLATVIGPSFGTWAKPGQRPSPGLFWLKLSGRPLIFFFFVVPILSEYGLRVNGQIPTAGQCLRKWNQHQRGKKKKMRGRAWETPFLYDFLISPVGPGAAFFLQLCLQFREPFSITRINLPFWTKIIRLIWVSVICSFKTCNKSVSIL